MPRVGWQLYYVNSQETQSWNGRATNAFDGDPTTIWHTQYSNSTPNHPHQIWLDLGKEQILDRL